MLTRCMSDALTDGQPRNIMPSIHLSVADAKKIFRSAYFKEALVCNKQKTLFNVNQIDSGDTESVKKLVLAHHSCPAIMDIK